MSESHELKIAVVMPVRNCLDYSKQTFESLRTKHQVSWIIIDNASSDGTKEWVEELQKADPTIQYVRNSENIGVAKSWNLGIQMAWELGVDGAFVINNDIVFDKDCVDNLVEWFGHEDLDKFAFVTVNIVGDKPDMLESAPKRNSAIEAPSFVGFLISPRVTKRIGYFDEGYLGGYYEDNDYHCRMMEEGIRGMMILNANVSHYGSRTIHEGDVPDHSRNFKHNQLRFVKKWGCIPEDYKRPSERPPVVEVLKSRRPKLLWIGDGACPTGFARVSHGILDCLHHYYEVYHLALNYAGDPHKYRYGLYPARLGGDVYGIGRLPEMIKRFQPDIIGIVNDPWIVKQYMRKIRSELQYPAPVVAYVPIDGLNQAHVRELNGAVNILVSYTLFGAVQIGKAGYQGAMSVVPHGVDLTNFRKIPQKEAREGYGLTKYGLGDCYIVGNVNRNQSRKRLDLTIQWFAEWVKEYDLPDNVKLYLHASNVDVGYKLDQLAAYYGTDHRVIIPQGLDSRIGIKLEMLAYMYSSLDVQVSTTLGEGWGLTHIEGMACGVPQILPKFAALGEWAAPAAYLVPADEGNPWVADGNVNTVQFPPEKEAFILALQELYQDATLREEYSNKGLELANNPDYRWEAVAVKFDELFKAAGGDPKVGEMMEQWREANGGKRS